MPSGRKSETSNRARGTRLGAYKTAQASIRTPLRQARVNAGLTQIELAALAGVSRRTVIRAEKGAVPYYTEHAISLALRRAGAAKTIERTDTPAPCSGPPVQVQSEESL